MLFKTPTFDNINFNGDNLKASKPEVPWFDIYGLRNRIVHDYGNVVLNIVYDTLTNDIQTISQS